MDTRFTPANRGVNFDPDSKKIFFFDQDKVTVATCWPKPAAWQKSTLGWRHLRLSKDYFELKTAELDRDIWLLEHVVTRDGQLQFPFMMAPWDREELNRLRWYASIPIDIRRLVVIYRARQWHLLSFLARCGEPAADLVRSSPALAFALASNWIFHKPAVKRPLRSARCLLRRGKNQKDILKWLGFPPTKSVRQLLARIVPASIDIGRLLYLRDSVKDPANLRRLAHTERLNAGALRILTDGELTHFASPRLVSEVSQLPDEDKTAHSAYLLRDAVTMHDRVFPRRPFPLMHSLEQLRHLHDELIRQYNSVPPEDLVFPKPPVMGTDWIVPILNADDLWREGLEMNHCVSSYSRQIATMKNVFVYKVLAPERCTLSIYKSGSGWSIAELKKSSNRRVDVGTMKHVRSWLRGHRREINQLKRARNAEVGIRPLANAQ